MNDAIDFQHYCQQRCSDVNNTLTHWLAADDNNELVTAMRYAVFNGGKRLRPLLVYATGELLGLATETLHTPAAAIELIHAYSLVHDDLPAMDDDDFRRGKPSCHKAYSEATAILVGDALQTLAFEILASNPLLSSGKNLALIQCLSQAAGHKGMVLGQMHDCQAQKQNTNTDIESLHRLKTGALFSAALLMPYLCSDLHDDSLKISLKSIGLDLGLAYQIQDDIDDLNQGNDQNNPQITLTCEKRRQGLCQKIINNIESLPGNSAPLLTLVKNIFKI